MEVEKPFWSKVLRWDHQRTKIPPGQVAVNWDDKKPSIQQLAFVSALCQAEKLEQCTCKYVVCCRCWITLFMYYISRRRGHQGSESFFGEMVPRKGHGIVTYENAPIPKVQYRGHISHLDGIPYLRA